MRQVCANDSLLSFSIHSKCTRKDIQFISNSPCPLFFWRKAFSKKLGNRPAVSPHKTAVYSYENCSFLGTKLEFVRHKTAVCSRINFSKLGSRQPFIPHPFSMASAIFGTPFSDFSRVKRREKGNNEEKRGGNMLFRGENYWICKFYSLCLQKDITQLFSKTYKKTEKHGISTIFRQRAPARRTA